MNVFHSIGKIIYRLGGYDAAESVRVRRDLQGNRVTNRDEDRYIGEWDLQKLRAKCWDLRRNNSVAASIGQRFSDNVVGATGITPQAKTSSSDWNVESEMFFREWSKVADVRQRIHLTDMERIAVQMPFYSGDSFFSLTTGGQLQPIECERVTTPDAVKKDPNIIEGVKTNPKTGVPLSYFVFNRSDKGTIDKASKNYVEVQARDIIALNNPIRFDQIRTIPLLAPVINNLQDLKEYTESTISKAKAEAKRSVAVYEDLSSGPGDIGASGVDRGVDAVQHSRIEDLEVYHFGSADRMENLQMATPGAQYDTFIVRQLRMIGSAVGLPYEFLMHDFSTGNYSSSRASLLQTYRTFTIWQDWLSRYFLQRVWNWRIAKAIKDGDISPAPLNAKGISEWYKVEWSFPPFGWTDPQSEMQSNMIAYNLCTDTVTAMVKKTGRDIEDVMQEKVNEKLMAWQMVEEAKKNNPGFELNPGEIIISTMPGQNAAPQNTKQPPEEIKNEAD